MTFLLIRDTSNNAHVFNPTKIRNIFIKSKPEEGYEYLITFADGGTWKCMSYQEKPSVANTDDEFKWRAVWREND